MLKPNLNDRRPKERIRAISKVVDIDLLNEIALYDENFRVREAAVKRLKMLSNMPKKQKDSRLFMILDEQPMYHLLIWIISATLMVPVGFSWFFVLFYTSPWFKSMENETLVFIAQFTMFIIAGGLSVFLVFLLEKKSGQSRARYHNLKSKKHLQHADSVNFKTSTVAINICHVISTDLKAEPTSLTQMQHTYFTQYKDFVAEIESEANAVGSFFSHKKFNCPHCQEPQVIGFHQRTGVHLRKGEYNRKERMEVLKHIAFHPAFVARNLIALIISVAYFYAITVYVDDVPFKVFSLIAFTIFILFLLFGWGSPNKLFFSLNSYPEVLILSNNPNANIFSLKKPTNYIVGIGSSNHEFLEAGTGFTKAIGKEIMLKKQGISEDCIIFPKFLDDVNQ